MASFIMVCTIDEGYWLINVIEDEGGFKDTIDEHCRIHGEDHREHITWIDLSERVPLYGRVPSDIIVDNDLPRDLCPWGELQPDDTCMFRSRVSWASDEPLTLTREEVVERLTATARKNSQEIYEKR